MTFAEQRPAERGAQVLAWYAAQWEDGGVEADDASVLVVQDVLAYSKREGELVEDICTAALASLRFSESEEGGGASR